VFELVNRFNKDVGKLTVAHDKKYIGITVYYYESLLFPYANRVCVFFPDFTVVWYNENELIFLQ